MENSREIKFRGQRVDNKEWVYGNFIQTSVDKKTNPKFTAGIQIFKDGEFKGVFQVLPETVDQFTGLKDKKGVEIYEGDLVSFGDDYRDEDGMPDIKEIVFDEDSASFRIYDYMELQGSSLAEKFYMDDVIDMIEVIGNIHDNPELLNYL